MIIARLSVRLRLGLRHGLGLGLGPGLGFRLRLLLALIASLGPYILKKSGSHSDRIRVLVIRSGYAVSWISVALFITAGFFSDN